MSGSTEMRLVIGTLSCESNIQSCLRKWQSNRNTHDSSYVPLIHSVLKRIAARR